MRGFISFAAPASLSFTNFPAREPEETFFISPTSNFYFPILQYFNIPKSESRHVAVILISHGIPPPNRRQSSQRPEIHLPQAPPGQGSFQLQSLETSTH